MENTTHLSDSALKTSLSGKELIVGLDGRNVNIPIDVLKEFLGIKAVSGIGGVVPAPAFVPTQGAVEQPFIYFATEGSYAGFPIDSEGEPTVISAGKLGVIAWNGSVATMTEMAMEVPIVVDELNPIGEAVPNEKAVADYAVAKIDFFNEDYIDVTPQVVSGYYLNYSTGAEVVSASYKTSDNFLVSKGDKLKIDGYSFIVSGCLAVAFDESGNFIKSFERGTGTSLYFDDYGIDVDWDGSIRVVGREGAGYKCNIKKLILSSKFYTKEEAATKVEVESKQDIEDVSLETNSKTIVGAINEIQGATLTDKVIELPVTYVPGNNYYVYNSGVVASGTYRISTFIPVNEGDKLLVTGATRSSLTALIVTFDSLSSYNGYSERGTGVEKSYEDYEYIVPSGVAFIGVTQLASGTIKVKKIEGNELKSYTKSQSDERFALKGSASPVYGISFNSLSQSSICERLNDSVGLSSSFVVGDGLPIGVNDFDSLAPWKDIRKCNIIVQTSGAVKCIYQGEEGFSLDGSNGGDVFLEIPKFYYKKEIAENTERRFISTVEVDGLNVHPAFIEGGKILDTIYVSAYESDRDMRSISGGLPLETETPNNMLNAAKSKGTGYSLLDMRTIDAIQNLMWIEHANRNSTAIIGHGWADLVQGILSGGHQSTINEENTNRIVTTAPPTGIDNWRERLFVGSNIIICDTSQTNVIARRKVVSIDFAAGVETILNFDGDPINVTTNTFYGSGPQDTGWADTMQYHTGRTDRPIQEAGSSVPRNEINASLYRGIENIVGNVWHYLPDITFSDLVPFISKDMADYEFHKKTGSYKPSAMELPLQNVNDDGSWVNKLAFDPFNKSYSLGESFTDEFDHMQGFGGFYYLDTGERIIAHGGGFDHKKRTNIITNRAWIAPDQVWYLYGCRLIYKNL